MIGSMNEPHDDAPHADAGFQTTHWSLVLRAGHRDDRDAEAALAALCQRYWLPVYAYLRRRMTDVHEAQDVTKEFFAWLLEKNPLAHASPERGRFRAFLLTAVKNFLANQRDRAQAQKRGGGVRPWRLDLQAGESRLSHEPVDDMTPERLFERQWVLTLLDLVMHQLETECRSSGRGEQFERLKAVLTGQPDRLPYAALAAEVGMSEAATRQAASRLRKRYRELLRAEVSQTLAERGDIDDEIRSLFEVLGR
jgi:DNA-directed RNA polymerase specialized sigma24 family protein